MYFTSSSNSNGTAEHHAGVRERHGLGRRGAADAEPREARRGAPAQRSGGAGPVGVEGQPRLHHRARRARAEWRRGLAPSSTTSSPRRCSIPIQRIPGVSSANQFGSSYSMRIWLNPDKLRSFRMSAAEVLQTVRAQNVQFATGVDRRRALGARTADHRAGERRGPLQLGRGIRERHPAHRAQRHQRAAQGRGARRARPAGLRLRRAPRRPAGERLRRDAAARRECARRGRRRQGAHERAREELPAGRRVVRRASMPPRSSRTPSTR